MVLCSTCICSLIYYCFLRIKIRKISSNLQYVSSNIRLFDKFKFYQCHNAYMGDPHCFVVPILSVLIDVGSEVSRTFV